jgi:hypothetical protein
MHAIEDTPFYKACLSNFVIEEAQSANAAKQQR